MAELRESLVELALRAQMYAAEITNGFYGVHAQWWVPSDERGRAFTEWEHSGADQVVATLWFRPTWASKDGRPRRQAGYALAVYKYSGAPGNHVSLDHDLDAALGWLAAFGYTASSCRWTVLERDELHSHLVGRHEALLWNRDDFGRDLADWQ